MIINGQPNGEESPSALAHAGVLSDPGPTKFRAPVRVRGQHHRKESPVSDTPTTTTSAQITETEFAATLLDLDKGRIHDDMGEGLAEVVKAVEKTAQKGTITLTISVEPIDRETFEETGALMVEGTVKVNAPRLKRAPSVFYATGVGGQITRDAVTRD